MKTRTALAGLVLSAAAVLSLSACASAEVADYERSAKGVSPAPVPSFSVPFSGSASYGSVGSLPMTVSSGQVGIPSPSAAPANVSVPSGNETEDREPKADTAETAGKAAVKATTTGKELASASPSPAALPSSKAKEGSALEGERTAEVSPGEPALIPPVSVSKDGELLPGPSYTIATPYGSVHWVGDGPTEFWGLTAEEAEHIPSAVSPADWSGVLLCPPVLDGEGCLTSDGSIWSLVSYEDAAADLAARGGAR